MRCAVCAECRSVKHNLAGYCLIDRGNDQKDDTTDDGRRSQRVAKKGDAALEHIAHEKASEEHREGVDPSPYTKVSKIAHFRLLWLCFYICDRYVRISAR